MKRYDERLLGLLLDRYEGSLLYEGKNQVNVSIAVKLTKSIIPEYFDQTGTEYTVIDEQLTAMERTGLIRLVWGKNNKHIIEKCELNISEAERAYSLLKRVPKHDKEKRLRKLIAELKLECSSCTAERYLAYIEERLNEGKSLKAELDLDDTENFEQTVRLLNAIELNTEECFVRELSIKSFHDSKIAEQYMGRAVNVLKRFSETAEWLTAMSDMSDEDILAEYNVYKNPSWVMLKGNGRFKLGADIIDLKSLPSGIGIAGADLAGIVWDNWNVPRRVLTIENLTSFHRWRDKFGDTLCIYLGGFANRYRRELLMRLKAVYPESKYIHFGDIDCGGFNIWKALCKGTGISFKLIGMDEDCYLSHLSEGRLLSENDKRNLKKMKEDDFFTAQHALFDLMLERGVKTEQECVEL